MKEKIREAIENTRKRFAEEKKSTAKDYFLILKEEFEIMGMKKAAEELDKNIQNLLIRGVEK